MSEKSLRRWSQLVRALENSLPSAGLAGWALDLVSGALTWSTGSHLVLGLPQGEEPSSLEAAILLVAEDDRERVRRAGVDAITSRQPLVVEHRINAKGEVRFLHQSAQVIPGPEGRAVGLAGVARDVTRQRAGEAALSRSRGLLENMLRLSPEAIVVADARGQILVFSAGAEATFGYAAAEVEGRSIEDLMPLRYRAKHRGYVEAFGRDARLSLKMHSRGEIVGLRRSGETFLAEASLAKVENEDGELVFTAVVRDLSEQKRSEQSLLMAIEQAERANQAKSSFLANMSHEIRTPLNGVLGIAGALARSPLDPRQAEMVHLIEASGRALQGLLSDILDLAKIDAGHIQLRLAPFDLGVVLEEVVALFRASAAEKGVELKLDADCVGGCWFEGDDLRLRQVVTNLLSNAVKFTAQGEVRVLVRDKGCEGQGRRIAIIVRDTGIGFAPPHAASLFERFEQADGSITRQFGGTGLGLSICKSLVELMGGRIWAESAPGEGARFTVELVLPLAAGPPPVGAVSETEPQDLDHVRPMAVLLAEDHVINRRAVEMILENLPVILTCVENGAEALAAVRDQVFDLVLMDMQMPVMDGLSAIREIRAFEAAEQRRRVPICVLSANAMPEHQAQAAQAGADGFLTKPIEPGVFIETVLSWGAAEGDEEP